MIDNFAADGFAVFPASESFLPEALHIGGAGCISATANINPAGIRALYDVWKTIQAREQHTRATAIRQIFQPLPIIAAMKATLAHWRRAPSWQHVRPPLTVLPCRANQPGDAINARRHIEKAMRILTRRPGGHRADRGR
ncbi:dihydrodipicolinate synthase family protein [Pararobbsia alpina]|uniref:4-hydroxy-tetrahydrodipicolinate synthase n=1 Tax=Pararobbsia alpina TaxID=621374 RepID=A0A6S7BMS9_9BURK|nr:dihydrodipicolinate synthase family protein [Pararobbsia alpina]CAB3806400.1 hypothetical protein LMG28138_05801 [Pararobbsia alpina]